MNFEKNIDDYGIELAIQKITPKITEKIKIYIKTKDKNVQKELAQLLVDRDNIYRNNKDTIKKYLEEQ